MDQIRPLGTNIVDTIPVTLATYTPLLKQHTERIRSVRKETFSFGPSPRQQLDVYTAPKPSIVNGRQPILIWLYGGGLYRGERTVPDFGDGLLYANLGSFFALQLGYTVVVPDYRLVGTHDDAVFPSGGEDVALAVQWIIEHHSTLADAPIDLFAMGNSAGGVHLLTYMLHSSFAEVRASVLSGTACRLRGVILLSTPLQLDGLEPYRYEVLRKYFGDLEANAPLGLLRSARQSGPLDFIRAGCRVLMLNGELDPINEIQRGKDMFIKEWMLIEGQEAQNALAVDIMMGHNHISPSMALGTGIEREEAWGFQVGAFFDTLRKFNLP